MSQSESPRKYDKYEDFDEEAYRDRLFKNHEEYSKKIGEALACLKESDNSEDGKC